MKGLKKKSMRAFIAAVLAVTALANVGCSSKESEGGEAGQSDGQISGSDLP